VTRGAVVVGITAAVDDVPALAEGGALLTVLVIPLISEAVSTPLVDLARSTASATITTAS
jgi:hypothetical protein